MTKEPPTKGPDPIKYSPKNAKTTRKMPFKALICLLLLTATQVTPKITLKGQLEQASANSEDRYFVDLENLFDLSQANGAVTYTAGQGVGQRNPVGNFYTVDKTYKSFKNPQEKLVLQKYVGETSVLYLYEGNQLVLRQTTQDDVTPGSNDKVLTKAIDLPEEGLACTDAGFFNKDTQIAVICPTTKRATTAKYLYVCLYNRQDLTKVMDTECKIEKYLTEGSQLGKKVVMKSISYTKNGQEVPSLIVYSQLDLVQNKVNGRFEVFLLPYDPNKKEFEDLEVVDIEFVAGETVLTDILDIYTFEGRLLVYGPDKNSFRVNKLSAVFCDLNDQLQIKCEGGAFRTESEKGHIAIAQFSNYLTFFDYETEEFTTYVITGEPTLAKDWYQQISVTKGVKPYTKEGIWIREVQGNSQAITIHYAEENQTPTPGSIIRDVASQFITLSNTPIKQGLKEGQSVSLINGFVVGASTTDSTVSIEYISNPFFIVKATAFFEDVDNMLTITVKDSDGSVSTQANVRRSYSPGDQLPFFEYKPPFADIYINNTFAIPFTYESVRVGNALTYDVQFTDASARVKNTKVLHNYDKLGLTFEPFRGLNPTKVLGEEGVLVTVDTTGTGASTTSKIQFYGCQVDDPIAVTCNKLGETAAETANPMIQDDIFVLESATIIWKKSVDGKKAAVSVFVKNLGVQDIQIATPVSSIAVSSDPNQNIFVSVLTTNAAQQQIIQVYEIKANTNQGTVVKTLKQSEVAVQRYCPKLIRADPQDWDLVHILSLCEEGELKFERLITVSVDPAGTKLPTNIPIVYLLEGHSNNINFCPMGDHIIVYVPEAINGHNLVIIDKKTTLGLYHLPLKDYGIQSVDGFNCFPRIGMYSIHGASSSGTLTYGLFYGDRKINNDKFVNLVKTGIDPGYYKSLNSFNFGRFILRADFKISGELEIGLTLKKPPKMFTTVTLGTKKVVANTTIKVPYKITGKSPTGKTNFVNTQLNLRVPAEFIKFKGIRKRRNEVEWQSISNFTIIYGPVDRIYLSTDNDDGTKVEDRKVQIGSLSALANEGTYDLLRGDLASGLARSAESFAAGGQDVSYFTITNQVVQPAFTFLPADAFDFANFKLAGQPAQLILFHVVETSGDFLRAVAVSGNKISVSSNDVGFSADKIRVAGAGNGFQFIAFVKETSNDNRLAIFSIQLTATGTKSLKINFLTSYRGVEDFDVCTQKDNSVFLYFTQTQNTMVSTVVWKWKTNQWDSNSLPAFVPDTNRKYWLTKIAASAGNGVNNVAVSTTGTVIFSGSAPLKAPALQQAATNNGGFYGLDKYLGYEISELKLNDEFIVARGYSVDPEVDDIKYKLFVYKRSFLRNSVFNYTSTFSSVDLTLQTSLESGVGSGYDHQLAAAAGNPSSRPYCLYKNQTSGRTVLGLANTQNKENPIDFWQLQNARIFIPNIETLDLKASKISIEGLASVVENALDLVTNDVKPPPSSPDNPIDPKPPKPGPMPLWPFVVIVVIIVVAVIVWVVFKRSGRDDDVDSGSSGRYKSAQPVSRVTVSKGSQGRTNFGTTDSGRAKLRDDVDDDDVEDIGFN